MGEGPNQIPVLHLLLLVNQAPDRAARVLAGESGRRGSLQRGAGGSASEALCPEREEGGGGGGRGTGAAVRVEERSLRSHRRDKRGAKRPPSLSQGLRDVTLVSLEPPQRSRLIRN
jgi:hypothetical protein